MIRLQLRKKKGSDEPAKLFACFMFDIAQINQGPRRGEFVIMPPPPGTVVKWVEVPEVEYDPEDEKASIAFEVKEPSRVIAPVGARPKGT